MSTRSAIALVCVMAGCGSSEDTAQIDLAMGTLGRLLAATPPKGRNPGTNQAIAELVRSEFAAVGVADVMVEQFSIPVSSAANHSLTFSGAANLAGAHDHEVNAFGGAGMVASGKVVDVGLAMDIVPSAAGKIALLDFSVTRSLRSQYRNIVASGAIGAMIDSKIDTLRQRNVWTLAGASDTAGPIPIVTIAQADAAAVRAELQTTGDVRVDLASDNSVAPQAAYNVIARIPGTTYPDRTLVIDGHLDSWYAGAADDGQAVAALVALAKALHDHPLPFTVELVAFDCEETFLLGSNDYLRRRLPGVRDSLIGAISLEMLAPQNRVLKIVTVDPSPVWLPAIKAGGLNDLFSLTLSPVDQMLAFGGEVPSDQGNFWQFGVPGFFVVASYDEYHTPLDGAENTDRAVFQQVIAALENTLRELGKSSPDAFAGRPVSAISIASTITNQTALQIQGTIAATNPTTGEPVTGATVTVTMFDDTYDKMLASTKATYAAGTGYSYTLSFNRVPGTPYVFSVDALISGTAAGRDLFRIE